MSGCPCGLSSTASLHDALRMRFDQLIGWAKAGKVGEHYLMDTESIDTLREDLIAAVVQEMSAHPR